MVFPKKERILRHRHIQLCANVCHPRRHYLFLDRQVLSWETASYRGRQWFFWLDLLADVYDKPAEQKRLFPTKLAYIPDKEEPAWLPHRKKL